MDYSILNFKHLLVILNKKSLRSELLRFIELNEIDLKIKFVDSYYEAALFLQNELSDPIDFIMLSFEIQNQKFTDFVEYAHTYLTKNNGQFLEIVNGDIHTISLEEN